MKENNSNICPNCEKSYIDCNVSHKINNIKYPYTYNHPNLKKRKNNTFKGGKIINNYMVNKCEECSSEYFLPKSINNL